ncbi:MAG: DnaJ domain-containing protein [Acidimicrobiales bacterium]
MTTHYDVLGVTDDVSGAAIKRAYYEKARRLHPDAHARSTTKVRGEAERAMQELNQAWNTLREPDARLRYDRLLQLEAEAALATRGGRRRRPGPGAPALAIGGGFRYWLGGMSSRSSEHEATGFNLSVHGATSLEPLRALAPDRLWSLHAQNSQVDDANLAHLAAHRGLRHLDLSGTPITDAGLVHLQDLSRMQTLHLWDTAITDIGLAFVGRLKNLRELGIGNTRITDEGLAELRPLVGLRVLQLWGTDVAGPGLEHLHHLQEMETVTLPWRIRGRHRRRLRGALPQAMLA